MKILFQIAQELRLFCFNLIIQMKCYRKP